VAGGLSCAIHLVANFWGLIIWACVAEICCAIPCSGCVANAGVRNVVLPRSEELQCSAIPCSASFSNAGERDYCQISYLFVCLLQCVPQGRVYLRIILAQYNKVSIIIILAQYNKVSIIIPSTRSALPPGLSQNPRGIPQPRIASPQIS
jgi:hypothetical protein